MTGKAAIVTGASGGLGAPLVEALSLAGYRVVGVDQRKPASDMPFVEADLASAEGPATAIREAIDRLGRLDLLVHAAGVFATCATADVPVAQWDLILAVNLRAAFLAAQAAVPHMERAGEGCIVNISSVAGFYPRADQAAYCVSKAGLEHLTRVLALDCASKGIRVNAVRPGVIETGMARQSYGAEQLARWSGAVPLGQLATPPDIVEAVLYLARARHVTGHILTVDGGQTINFVKAG